MFRTPLILALALTLAACGDKPEGDDSGEPPDTTTDADGDGFSDGDDCDDTDAAINPDADEVCDTVDNNCDGTIDEGVTAAYYADADSDGYGDADASVDACELPSGYVENSDDCNDADTSVSPDGEEVCDGVDNDCDDSTDEDDAADALTWYVDTDSDGYGDDKDTRIACEQPKGYVDVAEDCDDTDKRYNPGAAEEDCTDPEDYNCDGSVGYADADSDGFAACEECDDTDETINPDGIEICDGDDNDCDGDTDEDDATDASTWYADTDTDGYGDADTDTVACNQPSGYVSDDTDCDDADTAINPSATEYCHGEDDNCDGDTDEDTAADALTWYADTDADFFGDPDTSMLSCQRPSGYSADDTDCDDTDAAINPDADEECDTVDNNCDGDIDEDTAIDADTWYRDADVDGYGNPDLTTDSCSQPSGYLADDSDCDDANNDINPDADEECDTVDNDCDGDTDEDDAIDASTWYGDGDSDGYGEDADAALSCDAPTGYVSAGGDCDDGDSGTNPGATEVCDGSDNDCDSATDDADSSLDTTTTTTWYSDVDGDTYGSTTFTLDRCDQPTNYVADDTDCDDSDADVYPGAPDEVYHDGIDQDCDGFDGYTLDDLSAGDLVITEIMPNPDAVNDSVGEYFEIYNASGLEVDVNGLELADNASSDTVSETVVVAADGYLVFAINGDSTINGGIDADFDWSGPALSNSGDIITLTYGSVTFDEVDYSGWSVSAGISLSIDPAYMDMDANDYGPHWCEASSTYGDGDSGTPGDANDDCGFTYSAAVDIQPLMDSYCTRCHSGGGASAGLDLSDVWDVTVEMTSGQATSYSQVEPYDAPASYLYAKMIGDQSTLGGYGNDMPPSGSAPSSAELAVIEAWIAEGALQ